MDSAPIGDSDATLKPPDSGPTVRPGGDDARPSGDVTRRIGRYDVLRELGKGGMGVVYLAWQTDLRRHVALKVIRGVESQEDVERFKREAQIVAQLSHPNIIPVYEIGEHERRPFMAMSYIEGRTLDRVLKAPDRPPLRKLVEWLRDAARATDHAHQKSVVHRDLKPQNLIVDGAGRVFVMDFGLARQREPGSSLTMSGIVMGTPSYMAPEQARGRAHLVGPASDVYSLGATLYEMLTGRPPFTGDDPVALLRDVADSEPRTPRSINPRVHADLETMCLKAMDKDIARRYASAAAFADDLQRWLDGEPIEARPVSGIGRLVRAARRHKTLAAAGALAAAALVAGAVVFAALETRSARRLASREAAQREVDAVYRRLYEHGFVEDTAAARALLEEALRQADRAIELDPSYGRAHAERGRVLEGLGYPKKDVMEAFARAQQLDPQAPWTYLYRAKAMLLTYGDASAPAMTFRAGRRIRVWSRAPQETAERRRVREDLAAFERLAGESAGTSPDVAYQVELGRGLLAMVQHDTSAALTHLRRAREIRPVSPELDGILTLALMYANDVDGALRAARDGLRVRPSSPDLLAYEGILLVMMHARATASDDTFREILRALDRALEARPGMYSAQAARASVYRWWSHVRVERGRDAEDFLERAEADLDALLREAPDDAGLVHQLGMLRYERARQAKRAGGSAEVLADEADRLFERAFKLEPHDPAPALNRFHMRDWRLSEAGVPPDVEARERELIDESRDLERRLAEDPDALASILEVLGGIVSRRTGRGADAGELARDVVERAGRIVERWPKEPGGWSVRAYVRALMAEEELRCRRNPTALCDAGREDAAQAALLDPSNPQVAIRRGVIEYVRAGWVVDHGLPEEAAEAVRRAEDAFLAVLRLDAEHVQGLRNLGNTRTMRLMMEVRAGRCPDEVLQAAAQPYSRILEIAPRDASAWEARARIKALGVQHAALQRGAVRADVEGALEDIRRAVELAPDDPGIRGTAGFVLGEVARLQSVTGKDVRPTLVEARGHLEKCVERRSRDALSLHRLGTTCFFLDDYEAAIRWLQRAVAADPSLEEATRMLLDEAKRRLKRE